MAADGLGAAIDDDILNVTYQVVSFSTVFFDQMGNAIPELRRGIGSQRVSAKQFKRLKAGKALYLRSESQGTGRDLPRHLAYGSSALN